MNTVTEQSLYSLRATAEDCADAGEADRAALLRACDATFSEELNRRDIELESLRSVIATAYGYLWCVNNEPGTPHQYTPEKSATEARKVLRDLLTHEQRGEAINRVLLLVRGSDQLPPGYCRDPHESIVTPHDA